MKIYTKVGDSGRTSLFSGAKVSKASSQVVAYGTVDELNSWVGFAGTLCQDPEVRKELIQIQHDLHSICACLASSYENLSEEQELPSGRVEHLETMIDHWERELTPLRQFILAGGSELAARLHLCRVVARRAEREVVRHREQVSYHYNHILKYMNRLSDLFFVMARLANHRAGVPDVYWNKD